MKGLIKTKLLSEPAVSFLRHPVFWVVLIAKLVASALFGSHYVKDLFLPFINYFITSGFENPWQAFVAQGRVDAFPYSAPMLGLLAFPQWIVSLLFPNLVAESVRLFLIRLPMLVADLTILIILARWFYTKKNLALWIYWCSPIVFYISYIHGQVDVIPTAFLFLALATLLARRPAWSGALLGIGIATKMHLAVAIPFLFVYAYRNPAPKKPWRRPILFSIALLVAVAIGIGPFLGDPAYRTMVFGTREFSRMFEVAIPMAGHLSLYVAPIVLLWIFLRFVASAKVNRDLLVMMLALAFGVMVLLLPPMPGWYFWVIPLASYFFIRQEAPLSPTLWAVNLLYVAYYGIFWTDPATAISPNQVGNSWLPSGVSMESLVFTALQATLAMMLFRIYQIGVASNQQYAIEHRATLIGIGGDSGAGKHTLGRALQDLLGTERCVVNEGDDYHKFTRGDTAWETLTHLDPRANDMMQPLEHIASLKKGHGINKRRYDHALGQFTQPTPLPSRRFVFFIGLHPFFIRKMRNLLDIKIQVVPDENLRRKWKTVRDQELRGYDEATVLAQIERRLPDARRYVIPQMRFADWIFSCKSDDDDDEISFVSNQLRNDLDLSPLVYALDLVKTIKFDCHLSADMERQQLDIFGHPTAEEIEEVAHRAFPNLVELIENEAPKWHSGNLGVAQLLFLALLDEHAKGPCP